ncbi:MAG: DNA internalization-related competence protein ComEC/Rec2 [Betaproteobacteria bacterium]|nr:DNA internalization-related competence protein ComEC/Rec2 [Betaproteobacteria bacterium]
MSLAGFVAGILLLQCSPRLFPFPLGLAAAILAALAVVGIRRYRVVGTGLQRLLVVLMALLFGFVYADGRAQVRMSETLSPDLEGRDLALSGTVISLAEGVPAGQRFLFRVDEGEAAVPHDLSLAWFSDSAGEPVPELHPGQHWYLHCRLKRPHGLINPGGFDFEAWALSQGIRATGSVKANKGNRLLAADKGDWRNLLRLAVENARDRVRARIQSALAGARWAGIIVALVVGDQSLIRSDDWQLFWNTGVGHLISISGLHITMLAGLASRLAGFFWPSLRVRWMAGLSAATFYALLAGFSVPTQRTLYMISVVTISRLRQSSAPSSLVLVVALAVAVLVDPWAPLAVGFWLSFGAVAALMYADAYSVGRHSAWRAALRTQWSATWAMVPLLLLLFGQVSLVSPLANSFAIPAVSLGVVPLALLGVVPGLDYFLQAAHGLFALVAWGLGWIGQWPGGVWSAATPEPLVFAVGLLGLAFLLAPAGLPGRRAGALALGVLLLVPPPRPGAGGVWMDVLDVGQGLAVVIRTRHHAMVYDAGPRYSAESDGGSRVLLPALRAMGLNHLDGLVISHRDTDHSGGAASLLKAVPADWLLSSLEPGHPLLAQARRSIPCVAGQQWEWDGVRFDLLHPLAADVWNPLRKTNDRGCVLRITAEGWRMLLPADIEALSERELLERDPNGLAADLLIAPHHGSRTSSTADFLDAVDPRWVIFTVGYRNHFGHPKPEVVARYDDRRIASLRTDQTGAVAIAVENRHLSLTTARGRFPHYWELPPSK